MANKQHLDRLRQGVSIWNAWRKKQASGFRPDLNGARLINADLSDADLDGADLSGANLNGARLINADLSDADLREADLGGADLRRANLRRAILNGADLRRAHLSGANLNFADLIIAHLSGADLNGADLRRANLRRADLSDANLSDANLSDADLSRAYLSRADLRGADLSEAHLSEAHLSEATVGRTIFGDIDLRTVKGLETLRHAGPSTIGTDTIVRSQGDLPEAFLRGVGLPDTFIEYAGSLVQSPIEYYTCFLSYSSRDQAFAERLYADLQSKGVRCWYAPEDLKIGEKFWHRIDESIRLYDKLLVVLSQYSVNSAWVEREVMAALEKEQHYEKLVLFPIKLDEQVMQTNLAWAADIRRSRHIGNFSLWKDHDTYQTAFTRLLRDLQAGTSPKQEP